MAPPIAADFGWLKARLQANDSAVMMLVTEPMISGTTERMLDEILAVAIAGRHNATAGLEVSAASRRRRPGPAASSRVPSGPG